MEEAVTAGEPGHLTLVVIGQGYVGLPLAQAACGAGMKVYGLERNAATVDSLNSGQSHVDDLSDSDIAAMRDTGYVATTDDAVIAQADVIVVCVPTPLGDAGSPDLRAVESAGRTIAEHLTPGTLVVLESTTYPGTTEDVLRPILDSTGLQEGKSYFLAFSPERIDPGNEKYGLANTPKVVGGVSPRSGAKAVDFYSAFIEQVVPTAGAKEAEAAKLLENTYRHINIALVNEMAKFCHELGVDFWDVIDAARTKPFGFQAFYPGPGVGGHCIPIDPNYLSYQVKNQLGYPFRFVELAQEINTSMPAYVVSRIADLLNDSGMAIRNSRILLLGVTYKPNIADQRESPAVPLADLLQKRGAILSYHDPHVDTWHLPQQPLTRVSDLERAVDDADLVVLLQNHAPYAVDELAKRSQRFFDCKGVASRELVERL